MLRKLKHNLYKDRPLDKATTMAVEKDNTRVGIADLKKYIKIRP